MKEIDINEIADLMKRMSGKLMLTKYETAKVLSMSCETVDRLAKRGVLKPNRTTRRPLYSIFEIIRYVKGDSLAA
jgi:hypothetical protein